MRWLATALLIAPGMVHAQAEVPVVPSGQVISLYEIIREEGLQRWRFLTPGVRGHDIEAVLADMQAICDEFVLPRLDAPARDGEIVLNLMDRPVEFGTSDPEARQHFEAYRVEDGRCMWEAF